jgi:hypothetical protein
MWARAALTMLLIAVLGAPRSIGGNAYETLDQPKAGFGDSTVLNVEMKGGVWIVYIPPSQIENKSSLMVALCKSKFVIDNSHKRWEISHSHRLGCIFPKISGHLFVKVFDGGAGDWQIDRMNLRHPWENGYTQISKTGRPQFIPISDSFLKGPSVTENRDNFSINLNISRWKLSNVLQNKIYDDPGISLSVISKVAPNLGLNRNPRSVGIFCLRGINGLDFCSVSVARKFSKFDSACYHQHECAWDSDSPNCNKFVHFSEAPERQSGTYKQASNREEPVDQRGHLYGPGLRLSIIALLLGLFFGFVLGVRFRSR